MPCLGPGRSPSLTSSLLFSWAWLLQLLTECLSWWICPDSTLSFLFKWPVWRNWYSVPSLYFSPLLEHGVWGADKHGEYIWPTPFYRKISEWHASISNSRIEINLHRLRRISYAKKGQKQGMSYATLLMMLPQNIFVLKIHTITNP